MIARLWWKEARQVWPVWGLLAAAGLALQAVAWWYWADQPHDPDHTRIARMNLASELTYPSLFITALYLFLIAAAVFAGEREARTLSLLDALPVERWRVWTAKTTFALATTAALGIFLWLGPLAFAAAGMNWWEVDWRDVGRSAAVVVSYGLAALGWGLLASALLNNALFAAVMGMTGMSATLLVLADLTNEPIRPEAAPALLAVALLTTAGSALAFHLGGPPRWEPRRRARSSAPARLPSPPQPVAIEFAPKSLSRIWTYSVPRLVWETLREVRSALWVLIVVGVVAPLAMAVNAWQLEVSFWVWLSMSVTAVLTGVSAFNGENRGRTNRFLLQHGARPGVVWAVKILTWWLVAALIWWVASIPLGRPRGLPQPNIPWITYQSIVFWAVSGLTIGFGASALCGMVFRRGITAGLIALIVCFLVYGPIAALFAIGALYPWHLVYIAAAVLLVSWAWSGDWLLDRPGLAKWGRLGLYSAAAVVVLSSSYLANRVWYVPTLSPRQADRTFQFDRIAAPVAEEDNAAPLYREAWRELARAEPFSPHNRPNWIASHDLVAGDWDPNEPAVTGWLKRIEPALETLRIAARKPACRYDDLRMTTEFSITSEPDLNLLVIAPATSARARLARGDLPGAWTEIETLLRMARQYSHAYRPFSYLKIEPVALGLALRWAADPRQPAASLEAARTAWNGLPGLASPADQARTAALVFQNTLAMPRDELADNFFFRTGTGAKRKVAPFDRLNYDLQTTPWEIARARKVADLLAAAVIENRELFPIPEPPVNRPRPPYQWPGLNLREGGRTRLLPPEELQFLSEFTRLTQQAPWGWRWYDGSLDLDNEVARRALGLILRLRIWQVQHDGALPRSLLDLPPDDDKAAFSILDVYSSDRMKLLGYVPSEGQHLPPLGAYGKRTRNLESDRVLPRPTDGCMLLYSVGPDGRDDHAGSNVNWKGEGDVVFPLKDHVKPPSREEK